MEPKKTPKANIDKKKPLFFKAGLIVALALVLFAFEWKSQKGSDDLISKIGGYDVPDDLVPPTDKPKPPEKPLVQKPLVQFAFEVVKVGGEDYELPIDAIDETYSYPTTAIPTEDEVKDDVPISFPDEMPLFPGGESALFTYLSTTLKYPRESIEINSSGTVYATFVVERDGRLTDINILRGVDAYCDKEALRVVSQMPKWKPGVQRGRNVRVQFVLPIKFELR